MREPAVIILACASLLECACPRVAVSQWQANGAPVCTAPGVQNAALCVSDGVGGAIVVWQDYRVSESDLYAQHVLPDGTRDPAWPDNGAALCALQSAVRNPTIVPDGSGGAIVTWHDFRYSSGPDIFAQHVTTSGIDPGWPANGLAVCTAPSTQELPTIASDGSGGAIIAWEDLRDGNFDVYAQHVTGAGLVDAAWPVNGRLLCVAAGNQLHPSTASDGVGGAIVAWGDDRGDGVTPHVYAQHVLASGALDGGWPAGGVPLCTAPKGQYSNVTLSDASGGAFVIWVDLRNSGANSIYDIYAQRVTGSGAIAPGWPSDGVAVALQPYNQQVPAALLDGSGGAIVAWADQRGAVSGTSYDIYAQHLLASGVDPAWPSDGAALCTAAGMQYWPAIASDGAGGAIVTWEDSRAGGVDIYAQRVLASGTVDPVWPNDGSAVCTAIGSQAGPAIASDQAGGVIVAWSDPRNGPAADIYAERVYAGGGLASVGGGSAPRPWLQLPRPNPTHGSLAMSLELPGPGYVHAEVIDLEGKRVRVLTSNREFPKGTLTLKWDGTSQAGSPAPSGIYFVRVVAADQLLVRKVAIVR